MAGRKRSTEGRQECGRWSHRFDCGLCTVCWAESPSERASRVWNKKLRALAERAGRIDVPASPDYSTPEAITERILERCSPWTKEVMAIARQEGRIYREFRKAVDRAQLRLLEVAS